MKPQHHKARERYFFGFNFLIHCLTSAILQGWFVSSLLGILCLLIFQQFLVLLNDLTFLKLLPLYV